MARIYSNSDLRSLFQSSFNLADWQVFLQDFFNAQEIRKTPELINESDDERGYFLGTLNSTDHFRIGLFWYTISKGSVVHKKVGLNQLVKSFVNPQWGEFDAAIAVFSENNNWRLSLICNIKEEQMSPKRYTYVFGESNNLYNTPVSRFLFLQEKGISFENIKNAFSVEALTKQFYNELFEWYQWAISEENGVYFPNNTAIEDDDRENIDTKIIRLITRLMFVWFIKQKDLVPNKLFEASFISTILKDFDPESESSGNYYNAILQNLFFATLNRAIEDEEGKHRGFAKLASKDVKTLYRYEEMFSISEDEVIKLFSGIPFLNGGLFECLDKTKTIDGVQKAYNFDGFSRNDKKFADGRYRNRAFIPNSLFFKQDKGLFSILSRYNFTIEENTPNEQQVALDPELLGKVFENLLGAYNPETKETARNQSGSFYTPREIVNYMVDESIISYLGESDQVREMLSPDYQYDPSKCDLYKDITEKLKSIKILDPACGSGAFPMGLLNRIVDLITKLSPETDVYSLKLQIIENCIYGVDIQSIAVQISKLRFFISLICDCEKDENKPNFGIPTLPNLETKFVCANSLIDKKSEEAQGNLFEDPRIQETKDALIQLREDHFLAKSASQKRRLREKDDELRLTLATLLADNDLATREDAEQMAKWNPYDQNVSSPFFSAEWMFNVKDGFDIIIGNPPYIQLQNNGGELNKLYAPCDFQSFASTGDIYCLFYERGWQLLKENGHLCFITSNKWMRAGYGEKLRTFFANNTDPKLMIDFGGVKIFESATVDTNILLYEKSKNTHHTRCAVTNKQNKDSINNLSVFVQQQGTFCDFSGGDSWVILSPIEQSIKRKIEAVGTPLKDWDIQINYGIKTGYNDAFIISTEKRNEILANCKTEDERQKTEELIRPILRGRDIKRYGYEWAELWLINTHNGVKGRIPRIMIEDYPAVKAHLDQFWDKIKDRADQGDTPYNLRNCAYLDLFFQPKICWKAVGRNLTFAIVDSGIFLTAPASFISAGGSNKYLLAFLCSAIGKYYIYKNSDTTGAGDIMLNIQSLIRFSIPKIKISDMLLIERMIDQISEKYDPMLQSTIDSKIFSLYGFDKDEIKVINDV
ncbi:MAG: Eco57I restriction-modification methylase domain-containing protein [Bacteroidales bacterium]|nr:Eco57I restriction-modification methylase domain-containing protein [Bacteroidales bacterium]